MQPTTQRQPKQTIVSLPIRKLHPHPCNANRMSKAKFAKLIRHIKRTGHYEPVVVRRHPSKENAYQILNGHHRVRAMKQLEHSRIDCVVFDADDEQARIYLLSLNRLAGRDNVYRKAKLIEQLCRSHSSRDLAKLLGDSKTAIEKLNALSQNQPLSKATDEKPFLLPMTFFVTEPQHALIAKAFDRVAQRDGNSPRSQQRIDALLRLAQDFLQRDSIGKQKRGTEVTR